MRYTAALKAAGLTVFHVAPTRTDVAPVAEIVRRCAAELADTLRDLGRRYRVDD